MAKRILLAIAAIIISISASAENRWGVTAGVNISDFRFKQPLIQTSKTVGGSLGVTGEIMFPGVGVGIEGSVLYTMHGGKLDLGAHEVWRADGYGRETCTLHCLQIPLHLKFRYTRLQGLERKIAPLVYGGPVIEFTLAHNKLGALEYPAGNVQLECGIGAELFERVQVTGGYNWGMTYQIRTVKLDNMSARPRGWQVRVSYYF